MSESVKIGGIGKNPAIDKYMEILLNFSDSQNLGGLYLAIKDMTWITLKGLEIERTRNRKGWFHIGKPINLLHILPESEF